MNAYYTICRITGCFLLATFALLQPAIAQTPFFSETFGDSAKIVSQWKHGGTNNGPERWKWSKDATGDFEGQPNFASKTATNGFVYFNSDENGDNLHDVHITSPALNCSGQAKVFLRFENQYAYFSQPTNSIVQVGISTDGTNFTYIPVLTNVPRNDVSQAVQVQILDISTNAANQPNVFLRFRWQGQFEYVWRVDDVSLFAANPQANFDLTISEPLVALNYSTPVSQVDTMFALGIVSNKGLQNQSGIKLNLDVKSTNKQTFTKTETITTLNSQAQDTFLLENLYVPSDTGLYTVRMSVSSTQTDQDTSNNSLTAGYFVSPNLFSKDDGRLAGATRPEKVSGDLWEIGNLYDIVTDGFQAYEASFSVASNSNAHQGKSVSLLLYRIDENNDAKFDDADLKIVGYGFHNFTNEANYALITTPLLDINTNDQGVRLDKNKSYILVVQYAPDMFVPYSGLKYAYNVIATVVKNGEWFLGGFGDGVTAIARMRIRKNPTTSVKEPQLAESQLNLFPNPATREITVDLDLQKNSALVEIRIVDVAGRTVLAQQYENLQNGNFQYDVSNLVNGTYFLHARTEEGTKTKRFLIAR